MQITSMQRLLILSKLSQHQVIVAAFMKVLSDRDKPMTQQQLTDLLCTVSNTLDIVLNPP